ncbi:MTH1187 family thiamine-binding protein [Desulfogranum japonicum]|uniref:MTH1187 family thiamine-binding protein n=1 Tax=Desulfogranum japonicum TaxID=231447 RepID=UPI00040166F5|nr:MTH1187 family thiamine-binding protein [Desulfogranum japonicum]
MSCVATFAIFPLKQSGEDSLAPYVARALQIVKDSGVPYQLGPMGTALEGDYVEIMDVIRQCHDELRKDCDRVYLTVAIDSKAGEGGRIQQKVSHVGELLK